MKHHADEIICICIYIFIDMFVSSYKIYLTEASPSGVRLHLK
jgi:hypothetical protein